MSKIDQMQMQLDGGNYRLVRENDNRVCYGNKIAWIEWNEDTSFKKHQDEPKVGLSLVVDPHRYSVTWLTTPITEIIEWSSDKLVFQTENSKYVLTKSE